MCGIFGIIFKDGSTEPERARLERSATLIAHRGPDASGIHAQPGLGLAHTRLALVDLDERSNQPFWDPSHRFCLIYNGEIYNFRELRTELQGKGIQFRTTSDTEVLLQALIVDGAARTLPRLRGMFAFVFVDTLHHHVVAARDRFGIKPLHVFEDARCIMFASEVKAMLPWASLRPNPFQVIRYLAGRGAPVRGAGFYDRIEILEPGVLMRFRIGESPTRERYAALPSLYDRELAAELDAMNDEAVIDRVDTALQQSVRAMLYADASVGALCSGGVDSSVLMAMAARQHSNLAIFHADVVGPLSERTAATALAKHLNLDLLVVEARDADFIDLTPEVLYHYEYPFSGHPHSVPFLMVSKLVRQHGVKGVLTGEGSDECFLGYNYLAYEPVWECYERMVNRLGALIGKLPVIGQHLWHTEDRTQALVVDALGQFNDAMDSQTARAAYASRMGRSPDRSIRSADLLGNHLRTLLHRNDTMGMCASIEARFPFLDETVVATALNLPYRHKIRFSARVLEHEHPFLRDKWVFRRVAERYLPPLLSARKKRGFDVSAFGRMRLAPAYFKDSFVAEFLGLATPQLEHLVAAADQRMKIRMMMLNIWHRLFMTQVPLAEEVQHLQRHATIAAVR